MHAQRGLVAAARRDRLANDVASATRQHEAQRRARLAEDCETAEATLLHALHKPNTSSQHIQRSINAASKTGLVAPLLLQDAQHRLWRSTKRDIVRATQQSPRTHHCSRAWLRTPRSFTVEKPRPRLHPSPSRLRRPPGHAPSRAPLGGR